MARTLVDILAKILHEQKILPPDKIEQAKVEFARSPIEDFSDFLLDQGLVSKKDMLKALSLHYSVPAFDADGYFFDTFELRKFPEDFLRRNMVVPIEVDNDAMSVVAAWPEKEGLESALRNFVSYDIVFYVGLAEDILFAIEEYYDKSLTEVPEPGIVVDKEDLEAGKDFQKIISEDDE